MGNTEAISAMKRDVWDQAWALALPVVDEHKRPIGRLVPVGKWILDDPEKIEAIRDWRQKAMRMFLTQFESTAEKTRTYLRDLSVAQPDRLLFLIHDESERFVGHIGLSGVTETESELDNLMRGVSGGHPRLVYHCELALLDWSFQALGLSRNRLRALSYNRMVLALHEEVGYSVTGQIPLKKREQDGTVFHDPATPSEANVRYFCTNLLLTREVFYEKAVWLA
jgi:hypothetical protein